MSHTTFYNVCKIEVRNEIKNPINFKFWTQTGGKRKKLIESISKAQKLIEEYDDPKLEEKVKEESIHELEGTFKEILKLAKDCKKFIEFKLMFMNIEDILISFNLDPVKIKKSFDDQKYADEQK